ncbi:MAG TPA: hypothetical protein VEZ41_01565 [Allosphingosinicella sp.]|jgi:hypothetical protein|nr:hypothetical protein [Allosphingosinicella sp.]
MNSPAPPAPISYSAIWADAGRMLAANAGLLTAIAGVFLFLPSVLETRYFPPPDGWTSYSEWLDQMREHVRANGMWLLLTTTANLVGVIALYLLLLANPRVTVGAAMARSLSIMPFYVVLSIVLTFAVGFGLFLLIVPGIFLIGKLALATPILINETPRAPFTALQRSWHRSRGRAWLIAGLVVSIYVTATLVSYAVDVGLGIVILLTFGREGVGALLLAFVHALVVTAMTVLVILLLTAVYRAVTAGPNLVKQPAG